MTTNLTELETAALRNLLDSGFDGPTYWAWCATGGIVTERAVGGVVSSLVKKGLVRCDGSGQDATIHVTAAGREAIALRSSSPATSSRRTSDRRSGVRRSRSSARSAPSV